MANPSQNKIKNSLSTNFNIFITYNNNTNLYKKQNFENFEVSKIFQSKTTKTKTKAKIFQKKKLLPTFILRMFSNKRTKDAPGTPLPPPPLHTHTHTYTQKKLIFT